MLKLELQYLAIWWEEPTRWKDPDAGKDFKQEKGQVMQVQPLSREDHLEEEMATHSRLLA